MTSQKAIATRTSKLMLQQNISQYELAKRMGVDKNTVKHILKNEYKSIKLDTVFKLAQAFNMSLISFLDDELFDFSNIDF